MAKLKRNYTQKTLKILFALSGNKCAFPGCQEPIILPATEKSDTAPFAQICHIYALKEEGPRGKAGLTEKELNEHENLILFCPNHHTIVDSQHETYPAEILKQWKRTHEIENRKRFSASLDKIPSDVFTHPYFPTNLIDNIIEEEIDKLCKSRFFEEFDRILTSIALSRKLINGEFSGGTDLVRAKAMAWCVRILAYTTEFAKAEEHLNIAKTLGSCPEIEIANAFILSQKGNKRAALSDLARLDSPISRSAALMIVAHHEGAQGAISWVETTCTEIMSLDPDGKHFILMCFLELSQWEKASECLEFVSDNDFQVAPILHQIVGIIHLLHVVPSEFRDIVLKQIPFEAASFPLASNAAAIESRRIAQRHFFEAAKTARGLNCTKAAAINDEYELWLELRDPEKSANGKQRLETRLRDPKSALRLVYLGIQFGIKLEIDAVEREIERQIALNRGMTHDAASARFALAFAQESPEAGAIYLERYCDELAGHLDKKYLQLFQIEMFTRAGFTNRAKSCLDSLVKQGIPEIEESRIRRMISQAEGAEPVEARKNFFDHADSLPDLVSLVIELESKGDWLTLCEYGEILFERTLSLPDAERLAIALINSQKYERLLSFFKKNTSLVPQSKKLQLLYCWALYYEGALLEARAELAKLKNEIDNPNFRMLQVNLGIAIGDWSSLSAFVANEYNQMENRNAQDLIGAAQLALQLNSPIAKELLFEAAHKGIDDADILATAYFLASRAGWEEDEEVFNWLNKAASLSGENGPIQRKSLKDLFDQKPDWDRRESDVWQQWSSGDVPMFVVAELLNKTLIHLMLFPALSNLSEIDPRRRGAIAAYSGKRQSTPLKLGGKLGIESSALITLSLLDLLDKALDAFDTVYIPHETLTWLFEEKQKAAFHQPSQFRDARRLGNLVATGSIEKLLPSTTADSDLTSQIGETLSLLITEAKKERDDDQSQRIVVRPYPVYRVASLMQDETDLTAHKTVLSSCQAIVNKLREKGQITAAEANKARAYLKLNEKPWPNQPEISDAAILYLDDLATTYLLHLGILQKLKNAGFKTIVSEKIVNEANELIFYENISIKVNDTIERIRRAISTRIEAGKIKVGKRIGTDKRVGRLVSEHPTYGITCIADNCDAIIVDDRCFNQHEHFKHDKGRTPIFTTLEIIDELTAADILTLDERLEYRTLLRRAGYFFIPIDYNELKNHLISSNVNNDKIVETAELKAIRENILRIRMSTWLQIPKETIWLDLMIKIFITLLKSLWVANTDISKARACSDWLIDQIDVRGWAHRLQGENQSYSIKTGYGSFITLLMSPPVDAPQEIRKEYWKWFEERILYPLNEQYSDLFSWIIEWQKERIARMTEMDPSRLVAK